MKALRIERDAAALVSVASSGTSFACNPGQTILAAGLAAGLDLPYECASGSCGSCRCKLVDGEVESLWPDAPGLSERDRRRGNVILMCQSRASGPVTVDVRVRGSLVAPRPKRVSARVVGVRPLTQDMTELALQIDGSFPFLPGQFVIVEDQAGNRRAYSMSNQSDGSGRLELIVKRKPGGTLSPRLASMAVLEHLIVEGPYGGAYYRQGDRPIVCIAGGSGLAPMWSIAVSAARDERAVSLYFGVNKPSDVCFEGEFRNLVKSRSDLNAQVIAVDSGSTGLRQGLVGDCVLEDFPDLTGSDVYMAGPPGMIDSLMQRFVGEGRVDCDHVHYDRFA